ncbi:MAG: hypothetical protein IJQ57_00855 [Synergistaceae bacterium]|nr:hypothetical protein [Synergistaceae bacterium]
MKTKNIEIIDNSYELNEPFRLEQNTYSLLHCVAHNLHSLSCCNLSTLNTLERIHDILQRLENETEKYISIVSGNVRRGTQTVLRRKQNVEKKAI